MKKMMSDVAWVISIAFVLGLIEIMPFEQQGNSIFIQAAAASEGQSLQSADRPLLLAKKGKGQGKGKGKSGKKPKKPKKPKAPPTVPALPAVIQFGMGAGALGAAYFLYRRRKK